MRPLFVFLLFGLVLSILFSSGQIENPDTHLRLTQTRIILDDNQFGLPDDVGEDSHGNISINKDGQRFMVYNPGQTIIFIPIYYIANLVSTDEVNAYYFSAFCVSFVNYMVHALCSFILFKIALLLGALRKQAYLVSIFFGLTSYSFVFAQSTYEHHFEMFFILLSIYFALKRDINHRGLLSGLMLSIGLVFRTTTILAVPAILFLQNNNKERIKAIISLTIGIAFVFLYNFYRFGNPLETGYSLAWSLAHSEKFDFWSFSGFPKAFFGFLFSPGKGIIFFSTTIIIALFRIKIFWNMQRLMFFSVLLISATYLVFFSFNFAWHGSIWSYGPRYILPIIPFIYLPIIYLEPKKWVFVCLLLGFIFQVVLISVNYKRDVLNDYITYNGLSDMEYINSIKKEPHFSQIKQLAIILPKNCGKLNNYMPYSPWKKEIRTASNVDVLNLSIEKNSINFWWIRVFHFTTSKLSRFFSLLVLVFGLIGAFILFLYVKREFI
ncbi:MAG: hypothetical protein CFE21_07075 [Bacteroidetes bacterium B1(2017)]|nr:MAG: hypothetical protein CFE21_07075 [Bacteroidetes bacterium B1(2017)]